MQRRLLFAVSVAAAVVWLPIWSLPLTGEDFYMLSKIVLGQPVVEHVFRPLQAGVLVTLHAMFGPDATALHGAAWGLHLTNGLLSFAIAREIFRNGFAAVIACALYLFGSGGVDSVIWLSALTYGLSACGSLLFVLGLCRLLRHKPFGVLLALAGYWIQWSANENVYGSTMLVTLTAATVWCTGRARAKITMLATIAMVGSLWHYLALAIIPSGAQAAADRLQPTILWNSLNYRADAFAEGFGLGFVPGIALIAACALVLWRTRGLAVAGFVTAWWAFSFVPHAVAITPSSYRYSVTIGPTAVLVGALGLWFLQAARARTTELPAAAPDRAAVPTTVILLAITFFACRLPLATTLRRWHTACEEAGQVARAAAAETPLGPDSDTLPELINLDLSSLAVFTFHYAIDKFEEIRAERGFFDAATAYEALDNPPSGPWWGRAWDGEYRFLDPTTYFEGRTLVEPTVLYEHAVFVPSIAAARDRLADPKHDAAKVAVIQTPDGQPPADYESVAAAELAANPVQPEIEWIETMQPVGDRTGKARIRVVARAQAFLVCHDDWLYLSNFRFPTDNAILSRMEDPHLFQHRAELEDGTELATFYANGHGTAALVPPGDHVVTLRWRMMSSFEDW